VVGVYALSARFRLRGIEHLLGVLDFAQEIGILDALPGKEIDLPAEFCSQLIPKRRFVVEVLLDRDLIELN
jgi:hypothetical protein